MHKNTIDLANQRFGNLTVLELTDMKTEKKRCSVWKCQCDCGNICYKTGSDLRDTRRKTWSCGCKTKGNRKFPDKFVKKETLKRDDRVRIEFADRLKSFIDNNKETDIKEIINITLKSYES